MQGVERWFYNDDVYVYVDGEGGRCKRVVLQRGSLGLRERRYCKVQGGGFTRTKFRFT